MVKSPSERFKDLMVSESCRKLVEIRQEASERLTDGRKVLNVFGRCTEFEEECSIFSGKGFPTMDHSNIV
jgi:hypothetical protein